MTRTILAGMALIAIGAACLLAQGKKVSKGEADAYNAHGPRRPERR